MLETYTLAMATLLWLSGPRLFIQQFPVYNKITSTRGFSRTFIIALRIFYIASHPASSFRGSPASLPALHSFTLFLSCLNLYFTHVNEIQYRIPPKKYLGCEMNSSCGHHGPYHRTGKQEREFVANATRG